jgi:gamma-glutamyltranspeptidase/glutathione hydrolase
MVFDANGDLYAVLGSPGGSRIINYVAKTVVALIDWDLKPGSAVAFPHFGSRNGPTELEQGTDAEKLRPWLEALGHDVSVQEMTSGLHLIVRGKDGWIGAADPRREGAAIGE